MPQASQQIFGQLSKAVRLKRAIWLGRSVAAVTAYGAAIAACHFALDWSWRPGPTPRLLLLAALLAAVGYVLWREVWLPLRQLPTHDDLALEIERYYPLLRGRFISSVQLGRRLGQPGVTVIDCGALSLIRSLIEETVGVISALNLRAVPDRRAVKRAAAVAAAALLAWVVFVTATPTGRMCFPVWLNRLFDPLSAAAYPAKTIVILEKGSEYRIVARGEDVELKAHAAGIIPASGSIWIQRSGQRWVEQPVVGSGRRFAFVHKAVVESFDYYWQMGDGRSPKCHVEV
ncbi:hypothetical protein FJY63_10695, partial [Candidatus Sumerlaeota bacterium]|nr:hypothetical protein [Candidatus Sumerlaeota bacterium]